jgi:DNA-binding CsgD family transcriptional regulator
MSSHPHHPVLRKIAARRSRLGCTAPSPAWVSFVTGRAPQPGTQPGTPARIVALGGPRRLTQREMEVLHLVARGETDQGIADQLYVSRRTINCHVANILAKLEVPSRTAAVMTAARSGLLDPPAGRAPSHRERADDGDRSPSHPHRSRGPAAAPRVSARDLTPGTARDTISGGVRLRTSDEMSTFGRRP